MSLTVHPYIRNLENGEMDNIHEGLRPPYNDLFGIESWRDTVWGSKEVEKLDCPLIQTLKRQNIYAEEQELVILEEELIKINAALDHSLGNLKGNIESIRFRVANALEAIRIAKKHQNGGVCIS